ncbi:MAG TPA: Spy/CpxP family protein refolding chaperone [Gemmatimonadaceae bacterium]
MSMCPMMRAMMRGPGAALHARDSLHLSATQATQLEALERRLQQRHSQAMDSMRVIHRQINAVADAPRLDESAARAAFDRMGRLHTEMGVAMLRAQHEVAGILTPEQRDALAALGRSHMQMTGMAGPGGAGSDECAMMGPGGPGAKPPGAAGDSSHTHEHGGDSTSARP